jgi:phage shock protein PspC (stress-responsive transcriptional regulator)
MNATTDQTDTTPAAPAGPPRRLTRLPQRGPIAGVAEGLGVYFGLDPVIFRIAFVLLAIAGGSGVLAYIIGWIAIPEASDADQAAATTPSLDDEQTRRWVGWGLIVVAVLLLAADPFDISRPGLIWGLALIALGVLLFRSDRDPGTSPQPSAAASEGPSSPEVRHEAVVATADVRAPEPQRDRSPVGRMTVGAALLAGGAAALLDAAGLLRLGATEYLALLLVIIGGGLLVSAWLGHARWLIAVGLTLVVLLAASVAIGPHVHLEGGVGEREWTPQGVAEIEPRYELFAGEAVLDLTDADLTEDVTVAAGVTFGSLTVIVPEEITVTADARVSGGDIDLLGARAAGLSAERRTVREGEAGAPHLRLDLTGMFGEIIVRHP